MQPSYPPATLLCLVLACSGCDCERATATEAASAPGTGGQSVRAHATDQHGPSPGHHPSVRWADPIVVAEGAAYAGPWRMNESQFHYVDDPTPAVFEDGRVAVAWVDNRRRDVFFRVYDEDGQPGGETVGISRTPGVFSWLPRIVVDGEDVYVLWQEIVFSGGSHGGEAFFARSTDGGASFEPPVNLSNTTAGCGKGRLTEERWDNGSLDIDLGPDGTIHTAWTEYQGPLRYSRSTDGGRTFSEPLHVGGNADEPARGPSLAAGEGGRVHLAWAVGEDDSGDIHLASSTNGGRSFESPAIAYDTEGHSDAPKIALDGAGTLHLVHGESPSGMFGGYDVRYGQWRGEAAGSITGVRRLSGDAGYPSLAIDDQDRIVITWEHYPDPAGRPRGLGFSTSDDGGRSFSEPTLVPGTADALPGVNGSLQGLLSRKLDANGAGQVAVVTSGFDAGRGSRIHLVRGAPASRR